MKYLRAVALALALAGAGLADDLPKKAVPLDVTGDTVLVVRAFPVTITAPPGGRDYTWLYPSAMEATEEANVLKITAAPKGTHKIRVRVLYIDLKKPSPDDVTFERGERTITVGDLPAPPGPGPKPPDPDVPVPIPAGDLRFLEVHEEAEIKNLTIEQYRIIRGPKFRELLAEKCGPDTSTGDGKAYWFIDKDSNVSKLPAFWQAAFKRPRPSVPYIHIFKGDAAVYEGPLPKLEKEAFDLVNKYAGGK